MQTIDELYFGPGGGPPMLKELREALARLGELLFLLGTREFPSTELVEHLEWAVPKVAEVLDLTRQVLGGPSLGPPEQT